MVLPKLSSSSMKSFASFSKDDSGESKGKTDMTSLGKIKMGERFCHRVFGSSDRNGKGVSPQLYVQIPYFWWV